MRATQLLLILAALAGPVRADDTAAAPVEMPSDSFSGGQYVDSNGCLFRRVERLGGGIEWAPVVTPEGEFLCGFRAGLDDRGKPRPAQAAEDAASAAPSTAPPAQPAQPARVRLVAIDVVPGAATTCPSGRAAQVARYRLSDGRLVLRCAGQAKDLVAFLIEEGYLAAPPEPPGVPSGARFVQLGAFTDSANATQAEALALAMGLPVTRGKGKPVVLAAGPFENAGDLRRAWRELYAAGFRDVLFR